MHVLTLTPSWPIDGDDAEGCVVSEPLDWLAKSGVRNTVLATRPTYRRSPQSGGPSAPGEWIRYFSLPGRLGIPIGGAFLFASIVGKVRELHCSERIDLVHAHGPFPCGHAAMLLKSELNIPYVVSVYGLDDQSTEAHGLVNKWRRRILQRVYAESRRVVCASEYVREQVLERMGRGFRTSVVYTGVDSELFSPPLEPADPTATVLSAGNLRAIEDHDVLIRATAVLVREVAAVSVDIIGDGPERVRLQKLAEEIGLAAQVRFVGRKSRRQIAEAMKHCTVFVLPSRAEGAGCLHMEAMACGKAVIGCRGLGIAEIIQHSTNGFLVGPGNEKELALAMGMLLREPERRRSLGAAARDTILERLTVAQQAENLRRIYKESVAGGQKFVQISATP